jgi:hypothetical protein
MASLLDQNLAEQLAQHANVVSKLFDWYAKTSHADHSTRSILSASRDQAARLPNRKNAIAVTTAIPTRIPSAGVNHVVERVEAASATGVPEAAVLANAG